MGMGAHHLPRQIGSHGTSVLHQLHQHHTDRFNTMEDGHKIKSATHQTQHEQTPRATSTPAPTPHLSATPPTIWVVRRTCKNQLVPVVLNARRLQHLQLRKKARARASPRKSSRSIPSGRPIRPGRPPTLRPRRNQVSLKLNEWTGVDNVERRRSRQMRPTDESYS